MINKSANLSKHQIGWGKVLSFSSSSYLLLLLLLIISLTFHTLTQTKKQTKTKKTQKGTRTTRKHTDKQRASVFLNSHFQV
jgi:uncharacterized membrane protein